MTAYIARTLTAQGRISVSDTPLGRGGEGSVFEILNHDFTGSLPPASQLVAKIYHDPSEGNRGKKIAAMIKSPPATDSVAWPLALLFTENKSFAGYIMVKLASDKFRQWAELSNTKDRRATATSFDVRYALTASRNLATAIDSIHSAGHRVGDVNESNVFVGADATVLIVDADSAQIADPSGQIFPCLVGKPEYTAAELSHGPLKDQQRTVETDVFAYAVATFQMLTGGSHPTDGIYTGDDDPPSTIDKIRAGILPGLDPRNAKGLKSLPRVPVDALPETLRTILKNALSPNAQLRPSLVSIVSVLDEIVANLQQCQKVEQHWFDQREGFCAWCAHANSGRPDPWSPHSTVGLPKGPVGLQQTSLPAVSFGSAAVAAPVRRAPRAVAGQQAAAAHSAAGGVQNSPQSSHQSSLNQNFQQPSSSYSQGQSSAVSQPQSQGYGQPTAPQQSTEPKHPRKYKGKTILDYADGTWDVRPPLGVLMKNNPKTAIRCIKEETPVFAKAWWETSRPVAIVWALIVGLVIAVGISAAWIWAVPMLSIWLPETSWMPTVLEYFSYASVATAVVAAFSLFFSALIDMLKTKKRYNGLENIKREAGWKTILRFVPIPLVYGPILLLILLGLALSWVFDALTSGIKR